MENEKVIILADKNVAKFLENLKEPIGENENLFILDEEIGFLIKKMIKDKGIDLIVKILKGSDYEKEKIVKKSFF